MVITSQTQRPP